VRQHVSTEREILVQLPAELVDLLDRRARERNTSRSALMRMALERLVVDGLEESIDQRIIAGYAKKPQGDISGDETLRSMIREEPW
jgi:predicted transcriptional regulator